MGKKREIEFGVYLKTFKGKTNIVHVTSPKIHHCFSHEAQTPPLWFSRLNRASSAVSRHFLTELESLAAAPRVSTALRFFMRAPRAAMSVPSKVTSVFQKPPFTSCSPSTPNPVPAGHPPWSSQTRRLGSYRQRIHHDSRAAIYLQWRCMFLLEEIPSDSSFDFLSAHLKAIKCKQKKKRAR